MEFGALGIQQYRDMLVPRNSQPKIPKTFVDLFPHTWGWPNVCLVFP